MANFSENNRKALAGFLPARQRTTLPIVPALRAGEQARLLTAGMNSSVRITQITETAVEIENAGDRTSAYLVVIATPATETAIDVFELARKVMRRFARK